jgi:hypothetical protein
MKVAYSFPRGRDSRPGEEAMNSLRNFLQHKLNPVHMYCRLMDFGLDKVRARKMCSVYERYFYSVMWNA